MKTKDEEKRKEETANERLLRDLVSALVTQPEAVQIKTKRVNERSEIIALRVAQDDYAQVYGSMGRTMTALQTMFSFIGKRDGREIVFVLPESNYSRQWKPRAPFQRRDDWDSGPLVKLLSAVLDRVSSRPPEVKAFDIDETTSVIVEPRAEDRGVVEVLVPYLDPIFVVMGWQQGRKLHLYVAQEVPDFEETEK